MLIRANFESVPTHTDSTHGPAGACCVWWRKSGHCFPSTPHNVPGKIDDDFDGPGKIDDYHVPGKWWHTEVCDFNCHIIEWIAQLKAGLTEEDVHIQNFWDALSSFSQPQLGAFIKFACNQVKLLDEDLKPKCAWKLGTEYQLVFNSCLLVF